MAQDVAPLVAFGLGPGILAAGPAPTDSTPITRRYVNPDLNSLTALVRAAPPSGERGGRPRASSGLVSAPGVNLGVACWGVPQLQERRWRRVHALVTVVPADPTAGRALRRTFKPSLAERPYVFTKCSPLEGPDRTVTHSLKHDWILREAEASLTRLGVEAIDLYQIHWPIPGQDIAEEWAALAELKDQGLVRHIGVSNFDVDQLRRIQKIAPVETLQPQYSLIERDIEADILPYTLKERIGVIVYSPMGSGVLTGKMTRERIQRIADDDWRRRDQRFQEPELSHNLELVERLTAVAERHDNTPGAVAVAWTLRNPSVDGAIVGFRRPDQVDPILSAANLELSDEDAAEIEGSTR